MEPTYIDCKHCFGTGTCTNGKDSESCAKCSRRSYLFKHNPPVGLVCSVCRGTCKIEPMSSRLKHRVGPLIALYIIGTAVMMVATGHKEHFSEVLAFVGTLTGAVTGFYFSNKQSDS